MSDRAATTLTLTIEEAADELRISTASVYALIREGLLQTTDVGTGKRSRTRITRAALEEFLASRASNRAVRSAS